ncbi:DUF2827 family protein [Rodentibacter myodis]|uniref:DUF2827 domain-containing protein n=1 Tax=Rodentibacter myodis TaxID=1907939 RepID=A0A1V3JNA8_9PAST|nr:DUF2827 family protein [Rodentibacter myodis]OOF58261.1 hypothetical protein BKL49_07565 [Rodentibacter myodis]
MSKKPKTKKYKIGITFNLESKIADIWANGANQNIIFLFNLFKASKIVKDVVLVSWGPEKKNTPPKGFMLDGLDLKFAYIEDVIDDLDVLIEGTLSIEQQYMERMHQHNGKVVCYKMGPDYIMDIEYFIFDKQPGRIFNGTKFDANWIIPQNMNTCESYCSIMNRCNSYQVPAIWEPLFCDKVIKRLKDEHNIEFGYKPDPNKKKKRISSFEPNIFIFKNCFTPVLIVEQAYRTSPENIEHYYLCNTYEKREHPTFFNFIGRTEIVKDKILTVEGRYQMPDFLSRYVDIVLSHQWENGLNYAYNDALYGGYPFIHNSKLLPKGIGYYYDQFDAFEGAKVLLNVIENHDKNHEEYVKRANDYLDSLNPTNPINLHIYERELKRLFEE